MRHSRCLAGLLLALSALHPQGLVPSALAQSPAEEVKGAAPQWSLRIDTVDSGDASPDPSFGAAIDANLFGELAKTKQFKHVLRSDDRSANDVADLLILKTTVREYAPGREAHRAALGDEGLLLIVPRLFLRLCARSPAGGATKLNLRIRLYTREGHLILEDAVEGDVVFMGDDLRATHRLAHSVAVTLMRSTLPDPAIVTATAEQSR
jgi:hypothetical protein